MTAGSTAPVSGPPLITPSPTVTLAPTPEASAAVPASTPAPVADPNTLPITGTAVGPLMLAGVGLCALGVLALRCTPARAITRQIREVHSCFTAQTPTSRRLRYIDLTRSLLWFC